MWPFKKRCPAEKEYYASLKRPHIQLGHHQRPVIEPHWEKWRCPDCQYFTNDKCEYKKAKQEQTVMEKSREKQNACGLVVLAKISSMDKSIEVRNALEMEVLKLSPFNRNEKQEYLDISKKYNTMWDESDQQTRENIIDCLKEWRRYIEYGYGPKEAQQKVTEWLNSSNE